MLICVCGLALPQVTPRCEFTAELPHGPVDAFMGGEGQGGKGRARGIEGKGVACGEGLCNSKNFSKMHSM